MPKSHFGKRERPEKAKSKRDKKDQKDKKEKDETPKQVDDSQQLFTKRLQKS